MAQCIVLDNGSGVDVTYPVGDTVEQIVATLPPGSVYCLVDQSDLPATRTFRSAWRCGPQGVVIDMEAAKEVQRDRWREARVPLLKALDVAYLRALEANDIETQTSVAAHKQALRDVTLTDLSAVNTPDELEAVWPAVLEA